MVRSLPRKPILILLILALVTGCASAPRPQPIKEERSVVVGVFLAVVPGFFVHGLGNYYAGEKERARELMAEEGLGLLFMAIGAGLLFLGIEGNDSADDADGVEKTLRRVGAIAAIVGGALSGLVGIFMFFDSWIRDIYETPAACRRTTVYEEAPEDDEEEP